MSQMQLLKIPLDPGDVVYTPDWVARDMVEFFQPSGVVLDPCKGQGAFTKYLPNAEWCEIQEGRDFFAYKKKVDWCFGNPPYKILNEWMKHSYEIANHIAYIVPLNNPFNSVGRLKSIKEYGGIVHMRVYGNGDLFGMGYGFACGALYYQKDYSGPMYSSIAAIPSNY